MMKVPDDFIVPESQVLTEKRVITTVEGPTQVFLHKPLVDPAGKFPWIVSLHGGGFVLGYEDNDRIFARKLACDSGWLVLDIDYSLAPESPYPVALNQCYHLIKWMHQNARLLNLDRERLVLLGHGAGGNLVALISSLAVDRREFEVKMQILVDPSLDLYSNPGRLENNQDRRLQDRKQGYDLYLDDREKRRNPLVSPAFASSETMRGIAPTLIITAQGDYWGNEHERYIMNLVEAGNLVIMKYMENSRHGFLLDFVDEYRESLKFIIDALDAIE